VSENNELNIKQRFGKAVRRRRREMDLSQEQLAEHAGLHRTYISNLERGELNPSLETIERITNALDISIPELFINYSIQVEHKK
jgi:transcriptional regulator with XRE-family HTH domain